MLKKFLSNPIFHELLNSIDCELADEALKKGCPGCGGKLHRSNYPRSPLGLPEGVDAHYQRRLSFCCGQCRKRVTPPSVRFLGRHRFPAPALILISELILGATTRRCAEVQRQFGISVSKGTWERWRKWWREYFPSTRFWRQAKGLVPISVLNGSFPCTLLNTFSGGLMERLMALLRFISPITAGDLRAI